MSISTKKNVFLCFDLCASALRFRGALDGPLRQYRYKLGTTKKSEWKIIFHHGENRFWKSWKKKFFRKTWKFSKIWKIENFRKIRKFHDHFPKFSKFSKIAFSKCCSLWLFHQNLPASLLNRPIKFKETKCRAVQARLESKINLHPALAKSKIPDLGQYKFKWNSQVNPMKFGDFLDP